jgi:predicted aminopeptidase
MFKAFLAATLGLLISGCTTIGYYAQSIEGHLRLMASTRAIPDLVNDADTDPALRKQLERVSAIREFASRQLGLPDNENYRSYANLGRPYVVWNVFAAPEFSLEMQQWCMLVIGCVNYRGYFDQNDANSYASELIAEGTEILVSGVPAYTTLGYFNDPVLNTFLRYGDQEVARIVFHELAHQLVYVKGDTAFNESFAVSVEIEGVRRWLNQTATPERLRDLEKRQERNEQFHHLVAQTRDQLRALYASSLTPPAMRAAKMEVIEAMKQSYIGLKASWGGYGGYDPWFSQPINNATLGSISLYTKWVPAFQALLEQEGGDLPRFYRRVAILADFPNEERIIALDMLRSSHLASAE